MWFRGTVARGLKYLVEKHAREGAAITSQNLSGLFANGEEEAKREEELKSQPLSGM